LAAQNNDLQIMRILLDAGADPELKNANGVSASGLATGEAAEMLSKVERDGRP
jgi:ankyrin repeat protein